MARKTLEVMTNEFAHDIEKLFKKEKLNYDLWYNTEVISIEVRNGEWRKDHVKMREMIRNLASERGILTYMTLSEEATEEINETHYTALYTITFHKPKKR